MKDYIISFDFDDDPDFCNSEIKFAFCSTGKAIYKAKSVAELVRCNDCKYREKYECNHITLGSTKCGVTDGFYCADGEREETADNL